MCGPETEYHLISPYILPTKPTDRDTCVHFWNISLVGERYVMHEALFCKIVLQHISVWLHGSG
jgi:hypothetical protein